MNYYLLKIHYDDGTTAMSKQVSKTVKEAERRAEGLRSQTIEKITVIRYEPAAVVLELTSNSTRRRYEALNANNRGV